MKTKKRFHYGWVVFAACFVMVFVTLGFCSSVKSLFLAPITGDTGLPRSIFSLADSVRYLVVACLNIVFGRVVARFGARRMVGAGFISLAISTFLYSISNSILVFCIGGAFLGAGLAFTTTAIVGYIVEKWFTNAKGTIMGFILAANGLGASVASQILSPIIESSRSGWRNAYRTSMIIVLLTGAAVFLLLRDDPSDMGLEPMGREKTAKKNAADDWEGFDFEVLKKKKYFFATLFILFFYGMFVQSYSACSSAHFRDVGISAATIANVLSISMILLFIAKTLTGFVYDHLKLRRVMAISSISIILALFDLAFTRTDAQAYLFSVFSSFGLPMETVIMPLLAKEMFGKKSFSRVMGIVVGTVQLGSCLGMFLSNAVYDLFGTYRTVLVVYGIAMIVFSFFMDRLIVKAHGERTEQNPEE